MLFLKQLLPLNIMSALLLYIQNIIDFFFCTIIWSSYLLHVRPSLVQLLLNNCFFVYATSLVNAPRAVKCKRGLAMRAWMSRARLSFYVKIIVSFFCVYTHQQHSFRVRIISLIYGLTYETHTHWPYYIRMTSHGHCAHHQCHTVAI